MKVAINRCHGGFGISEQAMEMLLNRKGILYEKTPAKHTFGGKESDFWKSGQVGNDDAYLSPYDFTDNRADADLIFVIETLGEQANGFCAEIGIVEIPDDLNGNWYVAEYDGLEHIAERHRTWS